MKFYEITIKPKSPFGTQLKGDTLFGHFCWQVIYDPSLAEGGLPEQLKRYGVIPFVVFSSAFPKLTEGEKSYFLPRPDVVFLDQCRFGKISRKDRLLQLKEMKKKKWMMLNNSGTINLNMVDFLTDEDLTRKFDNVFSVKSGMSQQPTGIDDFFTCVSQNHNSINRISGTTGTDGFAPYAKINIFYRPGITLALFVLLDEDATDIECICKGLERIGAWGYGRDASTGMGRFEIREYVELPLPDPKGGNACYTLAPSVPDRSCFSRSFFSPFVRFGKHGSELAIGKNPFKRPVVMADEGAVFLPDENKFFERPWMGCAVTEVSYSQPDAVVQGYTPWLPLKLEL